MPTARGAKDVRRPVSPHPDGALGYLTRTPEKVSGVNSNAPIRHAPGWTSIVPEMVACILLPR